MSPEERALMTAALTGSLTLMSILAASIGVLYGAYQKFCIPTPPSSLEPAVGRPLSPSLRQFLEEDLPPVCRIIRNTARAVVGALFISAGTALFATLSLLGSYWWSIVLVKVLLLLEIVTVPLVGTVVVLCLMPR
jgi:hypothetical protein